MFFERIGAYIEKKKQKATHLPRPRIHHLLYYRHRRQATLAGIVALAMKMNASLVKGRFVGSEKGRESGRKREGIRAEDKE
jgi:hypothetical protein